MCCYFMLWFVLGWQPGNRNSAARGYLCRTVAILLPTQPTMIDHGTVSNLCRSRVSGRGSRVVVDNPIITELSLQFLYSCLYLAIQPFFPVTTRELNKYLRVFERPYR